MKSLVAGSANGKLAPVAESEPRLDVSRPSGLRAAGFLLTVIGASLIGVGAMAVWLTVGIPNESAHTSIRGTDLSDGRVVLVCALLILVTVVVSRLVSGRRRELLGALALVAGLLAVAIAAAFLAGGSDRSAVVQTLGIPKEMWARFGVFRDLGPGANLVLSGGLLSIAGAVLTLRWARRSAGTRATTG
jgi:hypothetical protein